jgi:O-antigen/teichoic acid export membrane protein
MNGASPGSDEQALAASGAAAAETLHPDPKPFSRERRRSPADLGVLLRNAASLSGTSALTLPLGFAFWWVAAHRYPAEDVGIASTAVSAMQLLATVSALGFGTLLIAELARGGRNRGGLVLTSLLVVGTAGFVLGCGFVVVAPEASKHLRPLAAAVWTVGLFAAGASLATMAQVLDQALVGVLRGGLQFWRNLVLGVTKLALLAAVAVAGTRGSWEEIYGAWTVGIILSFALVAAALIRIGSHPLAWRPDWRAVKDLRRAAGWHHALNLSLAGPQFALPIVATAVLSARSGAYFYVAWIGGTIPSMAPGAFAMVLYAVGAAQPQLLELRVRQTLRYSFGTLAAVGIPIFALAPYLLEFFGPAYRFEATTALRLIIVAGLPLVIRSHFVAVARSSGRLGQAVAFVSVTAVLEVAAAAIGASLGGISGLALGWTIVMFMEAVIMMPPLLRLRRWTRVE